MGVQAEQKRIRALLRAVLVGLSAFVVLAGIILTLMAAMIEAVGLLLGIPPLAVMGETERALSGMAFVVIFSALHCSVLFVLLDERRRQSEGRSAF